MAKKEKKQMVKKAFTKSSKKKVVRTVPSGIVFVKATFNNTLISICDPTGKVIASSSAGQVNFTGSRKSSAFVASIAAQDAVKKAQPYGLKEVDIVLKGPGAGRESAVRGVQASGVIINSITDRTPVAHNGCRPRKRRRV